MTDQELLNYAAQLQTLYILICLGGLFLLFLLILAIKKMVKLTSLKKYRSSQDGLADLLNSAEIVDDGIILCKNGALMAAFIYEGDDINSLPNSIRNLTSNRLNQLFGRMDTGYMFHIDCVRVAVPKYFDRSQCHFRDRISAAIDEERRKYFLNIGNSYDSMFVITVSWLPPRLSTSKMTDLLYEGGEKSKLGLKRTFKLIDDFKENLNNIENSLNVIFKRVERLKSHEEIDENGNKITYDYFLSWLYFCLTGINQRIVLPEHPVFLDKILAAQDLESGFNFKIGEKFVRVIALEGMSGATTPGMLTVLGELGFEYRFDTRFIFLDRNDSISMLEKLRRRWAQKQRGIVSVLMNRPGRINQDAVNMTAQVEEAQSCVSAKIMNFGLLSQNIIIMDEDPHRLEENVSACMQEIKRMGLTARVEKQNSMDAFFGSLPSHGYENVRRPLVSTANLADLIPVSTPWIGENKCPCDFYPENSPALMQCITGATGNTVFRFNFHVRDLGHTLVLGPTGAGKSTFLCTTVAQALRYEDICIYSFDKGLSMYALCKACGGRHFIPGQDADLSFCPLGCIETKEDLAWASGWVQSLLEVNDVKVTPELTNQINDTLKNMYELKKAEPDADMSLSAFSIAIQSNEVREVLQQYLQGSAQGNLIDAKEDGLATNFFSVFEIEPLMNLGEKYVIPVITYLFYRIEKSCKGQPVMIFLDEAWLMLGHPAFRNKIREWLKVMRKKNCAVIMATQEISDLSSNPIFSTLVESCPTKVFLPNPNATMEQGQKLYSLFGLNSRQISNISTGRKKMDYYVVSDHNCRMIQLGLGPLALAFVGVSDPEKIQHINELIEKFGEKWQEQWCFENQIKLSDYTAAIDFGSAS